VIFFTEIYVLALFLSTLVFWTIIPERFRTRFIILASFTALAFIQLPFTIFLVMLVIFVFWCAKIIERYKNLKTFVAAIVILVSILLVLKYGQLLFSLLFSLDHPLSQKYLVPLGLSYLIFKLIAFVIDVYREDIQDPKLDELLAFILFLPAFPAGPIERYQNFASQRRHVFDGRFYLQGLKRLAMGYFKKVVIVNFALHEIVIKTMYPVIVKNGVDLEHSAIFIILFLVGALLYAYFDLSAYADIAIGFGQLFGYKICENMNFPIFQKNIADYWNCWHISLSHWCRNNVYLPVLGQTRNNVLALYCSFLVMGLWHHISLNWVLWGVWHASGINIFSKWTRFKRKHKRLKKVLPGRISFSLGVAATVLFSSLGFSFIMMDTPERAIRLLLAIFI